MRALPLLLAACTVVEDDGGDEVGADTDPTADEEPAEGVRCAVDEAVVLATGDAEVVPLAAGQDLSLVHGTQGRMHVPLALELAGVGRQVAIEVDVLEDGASVVEALSTVAFVRRWSLPDCRGDLPALWVLTPERGLPQQPPGFEGVCPDPEGQVWEPWCGRAVTVVARIATLEGRPLAEHEVDVVLQPDPRDGCACGGHTGG